jgi:amino acid transporter
MSVIAPTKRPLKRAVVGRAMATDELEETLLPKRLALPIFASDPISSVAYATEAGLVVLVTAAASAAHLIFPLSIGIAALLAIVVASYRQTVHAYEMSGGAYVVAKENLGTFAGLVAAAALLTDYVLTVAVSVAAGVLALTSAVSFLRGHEVAICLGFIALITVANLRGVRESGYAFSFPTYAFIGSMFALVGTGLVETALGHPPHAVVQHPISSGAGAVSAFVLLRAFASGSSALTGVEAIANGVNAFRHPQSRNAATTLLVLGGIAISLFLGVSFLAVHAHALPSASGTPSVLSVLARAVFPSSSWAGFMYWVVQVFTLAILVLAANTSFQGFPRLAALLARDGYFARQFTNLGDRLVFSNGILVLAAIASLLIWIYRGSVDSLIHLYVVGVFTAFTLSQTGMVLYWRRRHWRGWRRRAVVNGVGAVATGVVTVIVVWTKFTQGAWLVIVAIPLLVLAFYGVHRHYRRLAKRLRAGAAAVASAPPATNTTLVVVEALDDATREAVWLAESIGDGAFEPLHAPRRDTDPGIRPRWRRWAGDAARLRVLQTDDGPVDAVLEQVWARPRGESTFTTVVIPELFRRASLVEQLRRPLELRLKLRLTSEPGVVVADVPVIEGDVQPSSLVVRVLVSDVHAASMRAVNYARALGIADTSAVSFAAHGADARRIGETWSRHGSPIPLEVREAPYRDLGEPLLEYLRSLTAEPGRAVLVVMPELVLRGWRRLLHNQRALYIKRLLLFEPHVMLASVPYQLLR